MLKMHSGAAATAAALFVCAAGLGLPARSEAAAQFSVSPLMLTLPGDKLATSLTLGNVGRAPVTVQTELVSWSQEAGEDRYGDAAGMLASPPIFRLDAGGKQVVRVGRLKKVGAPERELAYRIRLAEVPPTGAERNQAISTVIQLSLPVFVPPADRKARPDISVKAEVLESGDLRIGLANGGAVHDKVTHLTLVQDGKVLAERSQNYYVLAGARRALAWPGALKDAHGGAVELKVSLEGRNRSLSQLVTVAPKG